MSTLQDALELARGILGVVEDDEPIPHIINRLRRQRELACPGDTAVIDRSLIPLMNGIILSVAPSHDRFEKVNLLA